MVFVCVAMPLLHVSVKVVVSDMKDWGVGGWEGDVCVYVFIVHP